MVEKGSAGAGRGGVGGNDMKGVAVTVSAMWERPSDHRRTCLAQTGVVFNDSKKSIHTIGQTPSSSSGSEQMPNLK